MGERDSIMLSSHEKVLFNSTRVVGVSKLIVIEKGERVKKNKLFETMNSSLTGRMIRTEKGDKRKINLQYSHSWPSIFGKDQSSFPYQKDRWRGWC